MKKEEVVTIELGLKERVLQFYFLHRAKVHTYIACALGASVLLISYLTSGPGAEEAVKAKKTFETWKKAPTDEALKKEMSQALKGITGLERAKEAEIAQILISAGQLDAVEGAARQAIERLRKESPFHALYAEASLEIEKKEFQKALESSVALKAQMEKEGLSSKGKHLEGGCALHACNLLRIALLQKQVGNTPGELAAWEEVKGLLSMQEDSIAAQLLEANFKRSGGKSDFSLSDFISQRERVLTY